MKTKMSAAEIFSGWCSVMSNIHRRLYYRDQTPASFQSLHDLARSYNPDVIVELGTMSGMSLRCWLMASSHAKIKCIDLSFSALHASREILPLDLSRVELIQSDILKLDFSGLWQEGDRVLFFVDAHDVLPDVPIMGHVLKNAVPKLPEGSLLVVDDLWHSAETISADNDRDLQCKQILSESDELLSFETHYAPYHGGGSFWGFPEVVPLLYYVNKYAIPLHFSPEAKHVAFYTQKQLLPQAFNPMAFNAACGKCNYYPLADAVYGSPVTEKVMPMVAKLYERGDFSAALNLLMDLRTNAPDAIGVGYALGLVLARVGEFRMAAEFLKSDLAQPTPHPKSTRLYNDIRGRFLRHAATEKARKPGVTLFAVPKAFKGHENSIQRNAVRSWLNLDPKPNIILMGNDEGTAEICEEFGLRHVPDLRCNEFGTPLLDDIFLKAQELSDTEVVCYINADILVFDDFIQAVTLASKRFEKFLMVGARLDCDIKTEIDFSNPEAVASMMDDALKNGLMHGATGMDYFAFRPGLWDHIPPFALGRVAWDTWLLHDILRMKHPVVDCTHFATIVHQNHGYGHVRSGLGAEGLYGDKDPEAKCNIRLAGSFPCGEDVNAAPFFMHKSGAIIKRADK